jgi:hypothetical protein
LIEIRQEVNVCCDIPIHIGIVDGDSFHVISPFLNGTLEKPRECKAVFAC